MLELRQELEARSLSPKGLKSQLVARLTKTLRTEQQNDEKEPTPDEEEVKQRRLLYGTQKELLDCASDSAGFSR